MAVVNKEPNMTLNQHEEAIASSKTYDEYLKKVGNNPALTQEDFEKRKNNGDNFRGVEMNPATREVKEVVDNKVEEPKTEPKKLTFEDFKKAVDEGADPHKWLEEHPGYTPAEKTKAFLADWDAEHKADQIEESIKGEGETSPADEGDGSGDGSGDGGKGTDGGDGGESKGKDKNKKEEIKPNVLKRLLDAWKSGKLDMYPSLKAAIDTISKHAQMTMDRANLLTGKGSDTSLYAPIETETDKIREAQREDIAATGYSKEQAYEMADNENLSDEERFAPLGRLIASGNLKYEDVVMGLSGASKDKFKQWYNRAEEKDISATEKAAEEAKQAKTATELANLTVEQAKDKLEMDATGIIQSLRQEKTQLIQIKNSLAGKDYEAFNNAVSAYRNAYQGISNKAEAVTDAFSQSKNFNNVLSGSLGLTGGASLNAGIPGIGKATGNISGSAEVSDTFTTGGDTSTSGSTTGTLQVDEYLLNNLDNIINAGKEQMAAKNWANSELSRALDKQIEDIDVEINRWTEIRNNIGVRQ